MKKASFSDEKGMENETGIPTNLKNIVRKCKDQPPVNAQGGFREK